MKLQESGQMYLKAIYVLSQRKPHVRAIDVVKHMGYSKPSVSRAVNVLERGGYLTRDDSGFLYLTDEGKKIASETYERYQLLTELFIMLGVSEEVASDDACRIEHVISDETMHALKTHITKHGGTANHIIDRDKNFI
ncbi:MAG: metal-dependent transcriptional regulator [Firmicutes bacterium]|nr:metal-dependent transcriptional regulator [Bacillota bacterium]